MSEAARAMRTLFEATSTTSPTLPPTAPRAGLAASGPGQLSDNLQTLWRTRLGLIPDDGPHNGACRASLDAIRRRLEDEPLEDGHSHPAEALLQRHLEAFGDAALLADLGSDSASADFVRLLGRSHALRQETRRLIAHWGLSSGDIDTRDAALQAIENWGDGSLIEVLRQHPESVEWLREYMQAIIANLSA